MAIEPRLEPNLILPTGTTEAANHPGVEVMSIAISLKRIADAFEKILSYADAEKQESDRIKAQYKNR